MRTEGFQGVILEHTKGMEAFAVPSTLGGFIGSINN